MTGTSRIGENLRVLDTEWAPKWDFVFSTGTTILELAWRMPLPIYQTISRTFFVTFS